MADMTRGNYHKEIRMFRGALTMPGGPQGRRALKPGAGFQWYNVYSEPTLFLYIQLASLYLKGFQNAGGTFKFHNELNPANGTLAMGAIINATELPFLDSYNGNGGSDGIGLDQSTARTVTLFDLNQALGIMANATFATKSTAEQRLNIARVVIGMIEGARFQDVEDAVAAGTPITDRKWDKHTNQAAVRIHNT
jgi:hypothetical protein